MWIASKLFGHWCLLAGWLSSYGLCLLVLEQDVSFSSSLVGPLVGVVCFTLWFVDLWKLLLHPPGLSPRRIGLIGWFTTFIFPLNPLAVCRISLSLVSWGFSLGVGGCPSVALVLPLVGF